MGKKTEKIEIKETEVTTEETMEEENVSEFLNNTKKEDEAINKTNFHKTVTL